MQLPLLFERPIPLFAIQGVAAVLKALDPKVWVVGCQPAASDVMRRSVSKLHRLFRGEVKVVMICFTFKNTFFTKTEVVKQPSFLSWAPC